MNQNVPFFLAALKTQLYFIVLPTYYINLSGFSWMTSLLSKVIALLQTGIQKLASVHQAQGIH
jgi:hypothetical protein